MATTTTLPTTITTKMATTTTKMATTTLPTITIPLTTSYSLITQPLLSNDYNIGMMLKGNNNKNNLNDFLAKNKLLGSNLYISPMNYSGIVGDNNKSNIFKK